MGISNINDIKTIEELLSSREVNQLNETIEAKVLKSEKMENHNFMNLSLYFKNVRCDQFIIKPNNLNILSENIEIKLKDIKLKMIKDINYLEIKKYSTLNKNIEVPKEINIYKFKLPEKINNLNINNIQRKLISLKLKVKETDLATSFDYEFYTLFNNKIKFDSFDNFSEDELKMINFICLMDFIMIIMYYIK